MKYGEWLNYNHKVEREELDKSGRTLVILGQEKSDLVVVMRENQPKDNDFFIIKLTNKKEANMIADRWIRCR